MDEPKGKDAPPWYGGRLILPLVEYWKLRRSEESPSAVPGNTLSLSGPRADEVQAFLEKLIRYPVEVSTFIKPDGAVERGEGWWGHLHGTMDMTAGIAEYGRLAHRPELVAWAKRVYEWIGRTNTTRYGWMADVSGGTICESCGIASRLRLGLALYRAGAVDPFGESDRFLRNQLLENQFVNLDFLTSLKPETPRTEQKVFDGVDRMIRGTFQCWGTANDLMGNEDLEGCGAGGGVQALALAWDAQAEWRPVPGNLGGQGSNLRARDKSLEPTSPAASEGEELRIHLLFNRRLRARPEAPFASTAPIAAELWSYLPNEGRVTLLAHQNIDRVAMRLPDGADPATAKVSRSTLGPSFSSATAFDGPYVLIDHLAAGEQIDLRFTLQRYETTERAAGVEYRVQWKASAVTSLEPRGPRCPLYCDRTNLLNATAPLCAPRYP